MSGNSILNCFKDVSGITKGYFSCLHLAYFYDWLSRKIDFSRLTSNITLLLEKNSRYLLDKDIIESLLKEIYEKPDTQSFFAYYALLNTIRGISMSFFESFRNEEFKSILLEHIFKNDKYKLINFEGVIRFIRNTLSHNTRNRILTSEED